MFHTDLTPFGVDMERLTKQRLERLQQAMKQYGLDALMLTDHQNVRYATNSVFMLGLRATAIQRFVLVPASGPPLICHRETARKRGVSPRFGAYMFAMRPPIATNDFVSQAIAGLKELGVARERVGVDSLNLEAVEGLRDGGVHLVDAWRALNKARAVKTIDELQLIRWTTGAKEHGYDLVRQALRDL